VTLDAEQEGRRSQAERRAATVGKVLDAALASFAEVGDARTTIGRVSELSGVSQGGLARYFPSRLDLMVAAAEQVLVVDRAAFTARAGRPGVTTLELLRLLREMCRSPLNGAWYELLAASRTDVELRERLAPLGARLTRHVTGLAAGLPGLQHLPDTQRQTMLVSVIYLFDGEALAAQVHPHPEQEEARLHLAVALIESAAVVPA